MTMSLKMFEARPIAFYLPQYHPIHENDSWWGKGFTEWTNVVKAQPLFPGHYQPHLPADLGFYDLRVAEARSEQAALAKSYGIHGFCYYHYWFSGKRLLERPFNEVLSSGQPDFPFCLCWANETWSRRWLGEERNVLMKQSYCETDDHDHIFWLLKAFTDSRYIKISNRPLFLIYRPHDLPNPLKTTNIFRETCIKNGLPEPYLVGVDAHHAGFDYRQFGFDETLRFEPQLSVLSRFMEDQPSLPRLLRNLRFGVFNPALKLYDYELARQLMMNKAQDLPVIPSIFVSWDNTARRGKNGVIVVNSTPDKFERGLLEIVRSVQHRPMEERLVFINAWNEWAEGNHLEPDQKYGTQYLEAVRRVVSSQETASVKP